MLIEEKQPTNREIIIQAIEMDLWSYCRLIASSYIKWCQFVGDKLHMNYLELVTNIKIESYYRKQFELLVENLFIKDNQEYLQEKIKAKDIYMDFLHDYIAHLNYYYPASLVKEKPKNTHKINKQITINLN